MRRAELVWRYAPALLWAAVLLSMSGNAGSSSITGDILSVVVSPANPWFDVIHFLLRKTGHVVAYGILGWLNYRAVRRPVIAVLLAIVVASLDEFRQSFYASRTAMPTDVVIDACGASLAQLLASRFS